MYVTFLLLFGCVFCACRNVYAGSYTWFWYYRTRGDWTEDATRVFFPLNFFTVVSFLVAAISRKNLVSRFIRTSYYVWNASSNKCKQKIQTKDRVECYTLCWRAQWTYNALIISILTKIKKNGITTEIICA